MCKPPPRKNNITEGKQTAGPYIQGPAFCYPGAWWLSHYPGSKPYGQDPVRLQQGLGLREPEKDPNRKTIEKIEYEEIGMEWKDGE